MSRKYHRLWAGDRGASARECYEGNFIGVGYIRKKDLAECLSMPLAEFQSELKSQFIDEDKERHEQNAKGKYRPKALTTIKSRLSALHGFLSQISKGDIVVCPDRRGGYIAGEIIRGYHFAPDSALPQRLGVKWLTGVLSDEDMGAKLLKTIHKRGALVELEGYAEAIQRIIDNNPREPSGLDPFFGSEPFATEADLEKEFTQRLAERKLLGGRMINEEGGWTIQEKREVNGGIIDLLAVNDKNRELFVVEIRNSAATSSTLGQVIGYMASLKSAPEYRRYSIKGYIVAPGAGRRLKCALGFNFNVELYRYQKEPFKLVRFVP